MSGDALTPLVVVCRGVVCSVLPVPANAYRPYALRHPVLACINAIVLGIAIGASLLLSLTPEVARLSTISAAAIFRLTNAERVKAGFAPLQEASALVESATGKGRHMIERDYFDHTYTDPATKKEITPWAWFAKYHYRYAGENLAIDFTSAEDIVSAWMASPGHRRNILSDRYVDLGIGVAAGEFEGRTATIVVQHFGRTQANALAEAPRAAGKALAAAVLPAVARPAAAPIPLAAPVLLEPGEGTLVSHRALRVSGKAPAAERVDIRLDGQSTAQFAPRADGTFAGLLGLPTDTERAVVLTAVALAKGQRSPISSPRRIRLDTKAPVLTGEDLLILPDPLGAPGAVLVAVPLLQDATRADLLQDGDSVLPFERHGGVLVKALSALPPAGLRIRALDGAGNARIVETSLPFQYSTVSRELFAPRAQIARTLGAARPWLTSILWVLAGTLAVNLFFHVRTRHLLHPDLFAHGALVLLVGTVTLWLT